MPTLVPESAGPGPRIQGLTGHGFRIDGVVHAAGVLLTPSVATGWTAPAFEALDAAALAPLLAVAPRLEFVLLGTGATLRRPPPALAAAFAEKGIGIDVMDSRAAARAWGVLRAEDRWIGAALLPF